MIFNPSFYRKAGWLTCFSILLLVLAGGIVRTTGAGMGCPDWPTCFGTYIPPTHENQLPENYKEIFLEKRLKKIDKYVEVLQQFGFQEKAKLIAQNEAIKEAEPFSVVSTWIEAINRYLGALTGLFALIALISATQFIKNKTSIFILTLLGVIAILINAWMGSVVVATNLMQGPITVHYLAAFLALALFMWPLVKLDLKQIPTPTGGKLIVATVFMLVLIQNVTGTWSRETIDLLMSKGTLVNESSQLNHQAMGILFIVHRYLAIPIFLLILLKYRKSPQGHLKNILLASLIIISTQVIAGSINIIWVLPSFTQAYHIFAGGVIFALCLYLFLHHFVNKYSG